jgi:hypothetical protein
MPLDQDVQQAVLRLHFGMTLPFWEAAVRVQLARLEPRESEFITYMAALRRRQAGGATAEDDAVIAATSQRLEEKFKAGHGPMLIDQQD